LLGNLIVEINPVRIRFFNQPNLPGAISALQPFFSTNRIFNVAELLKINKSLNFMSFGEAFHQPFAVLAYSSH